MADSREAKRLIKQHKEWLNSLTGLASNIPVLRDDITRFSNELLMQEVLQLLAQIPIEEVNRDKRGIRVKLLRDHGFNTISDISSSSVYAIASINGISADGAYYIRQIVDSIIATTYQGAKLRLSEDNKTPRATQLVTSISKYRRILPLIHEGQKIYDMWHQSVENALHDYKPAQSGIRWLISTKSRKQKAEQAGTFLSSLCVGDYGTSVTRLFQSYNEIIRTTNEEAWRDFSSNSIRFFNILEEINPEIIESSNTVYGLSEDMAREIQEQAFFPDGLLCDLRRYQEWGVKFILHQERVLLGDEMGLGKTVQAIATMVSLRNTGATHFLVVCPASVLINWCREIQKMSLLMVTKIHGGNRLGALESWKRTGGVAVTTYETTKHILLEDAFKLSLIVVDEAHYIKNPDAQRSENVRLLCKHSERVLLMTGTALENRVDEMISLINVLRPQVALSVRGLEYIASAPQFREKVAPVYYRRKREDVLSELPDLIESREWCVMGREEETVYENAVLSRKYADARRVSWNVSDLSRSSKATRLLELLNEAQSENRKVIVFSFFLSTIGTITNALGERCKGPINGSVSPQKRQEIIDDFEQAPAGAVLVAQIQAGGTGLNIQTASVVIICEPQFKPSIENQAISRAYRMGQTRNVLVYRLLCENSVDERITERLDMKQRIFDEFADQSVAANESNELDDEGFGSIIEEEIERINAKRGAAKYST